MTDETRRMYRGEAVHRAQSMWRSATILAGENQFLLRVRQGRIGWAKYKGLRAG